MIKFSSSSRKPLLLQHHKPIPIATYIPKFDEGYNPNRKFDPDTERAEANKIRSLYKKEKKGAIRELRKDNKFLAGEEQKIKAVKDAEYGKKVRPAWLLCKHVTDSSPPHRSPRLWEVYRTRGPRKRPSRHPRCVATRRFRVGLKLTRRFAGQGKEAGQGSSEVVDITLQPQFVYSTQPERYRASPGRLAWMG